MINQLYATNFYKMNYLRAESQRLLNS